MEIKKIAQLFLLSVVLSIVSLLVPISSAFAASGTISVVPSTGTFHNGQVFTIGIRVDGGGTAFNAAKASVAVSQNLSVESLTLGDCDFALVKTPSQSDLAFAGVILGGSKDSCTIYTLNLKVESPGTGFVFLSDGSIKSAKGAGELLSTVKNSSYAFDGPSSGSTSNSIASIPTPAPTQPPLALANGIKLYTLVYNISSSDKTQSANLKVVLDQGKPDELLSTPSPTTNDPTVLAATFDNVTQGIHTLTVLENEKSVSSQVINLQGQNRDIVLGVTPKSGVTTSILGYLALAIALIVLVTGIVLTYVVVWRKNHPTTV